MQDEGRDLGGQIAPVVGEAADLHAAAGGAFGDGPIRSRTLFLNQAVCTSDDGGNQQSDSQRRQPRRLNAMILTALASLERRIEIGDGDLAPRILEPLVQRLVDSLLRQDLLDLVARFIEGWNRLDPFCSHSETCC